MTVRQYIRYAIEWRINSIALGRLYAAYDEHQQRQITQALDECAGPLVFE